MLFKLTLDVKDWKNKSDKYMPFSAYLTPSMIRAILLPWLCHKCCSPGHIVHYIGSTMMLYSEYM